MLKAGSLMIFSTVFVITLGSGGGAGLVSVSGVLSFVPACGSEPLKVTDGVPAPVSNPSHANILFLKSLRSVMVVRAKLEIFIRRSAITSFNQIGAEVIISPARLSAPRNNDNN